MGTEYPNGLFCCIGLPSLAASLPRRTSPPESLLDPVRHHHPQLCLSRLSPLKSNPVGQSRVVLAAHPMQSATAPTRPQERSAVD